MMSVPMMRSQFNFDTTHTRFLLKGYTLDRLMIPAANNFLFEFSFRFDLAIGCWVLHHYTFFVLQILSSLCGEVL
ncbi:hypothetical protein RJT34_10831 [Clitoria ternatea]|uniref:Uncharacterized protein n=1 Tax=Clitoria ternatea TaxID=43366 RepID=A0AAN9JIS6_CLITE